MKRILSCALVLALAVGMAGCSLQDYQQAAKLYKAGEYAQAQAIYESLGDFADSADMARISAQKACYQLAGQQLAAGAYEEAAELYDSLGMYSDSPLQAAEARYAGGKVSLEKGDYARAVQLLEQLGGYKDSADLLSRAKWEWVSGSRYTKVLQDDEKGFAAISLEPRQDGNLRILLEKRGQILNLPYETEFTMTLMRTRPDAAYMLTYTSTNVATIKETASGIVTLRAFSEGLPVTAFSQTVTAADGTVTKSDQTADALMMKAVMAEVVADVTENLPLLLEKSGAQVTAEDLGF